MPHVFSAEESDGSPKRFSNEQSLQKPTVSNDGSVVNYGSASSEFSLSVCVLESTDGVILASLSQLLNQYSCIPDVYNNGKYYNYISLTANENGISSICSKGWTQVNISGRLSFGNLFEIYGITDKVSNIDTPLLNLPLSYIRTSYYDAGNVVYAGIYGYYSGRDTILAFRQSSLDIGSFNRNSTLGVSLRCGGK